MPGSELTVHVNRDATDTLDPDVETLETRGSLAVELHGHERPAHVHCRLEGALERIATLEQTNYYIEPGSVTAVPIRIDNGPIDDPIEGRLEVVTGYGSESVSIDVTVTPPPPSVDVDESLTEPRRDRSNQSAAPGVLEGIDGASGLDPATLAVLVLGILAVAVGTVSAATIGGVVGVVGAVIVVGGVGVALWMLFA
ncbi:hypothetical protein D8Y22_20295 [Salinadaptatus halalkaliphilus]|uniref:Uncharacterized protein n=1 Tax=Salinadaptatus halalkaliphilus TaxID=2419781 RepID=A0A4S3TIW8_9EURY|nr:hypothetical protein [Salinadaptatus halalkaliphilus]THE62805.1 hypothetical protein D8Y22_20295 [Salinadaptatus halalkaliphilus]